MKSTKFIHWKCEFIYKKNLSSPTLTRPKTIKNKKKNLTEQAKFVECCLCINISIMPNDPLTSKSIKGDYFDGVFFFIS